MLSGWNLILLGPVMAGMLSASFSWFLSCAKPGYGRDRTPPTPNQYPPAAQVATVGQLCAAAKNGVPPVGWGGGGVWGRDLGGGGVALLYSILLLLIYTFYVYTFMYIFNIFLYI